MIENKYNFIKEIGKGSFGIVYLAEVKNNSNDKQLVAIKKLNKKNNTIPDLEYDNILNNEIEIHSILSEYKHPLILGFIESVNESNHKYLVLEYCEGGDLDTYLEYATKAFTKCQLCGIIQQIITTLAFLHNINVTHNDLRRENILLVNNPDNISINEPIIIKISDFGLAKLELDDQQAIHRKYQDRCRIGFIICQFVVFGFVDVMGVFQDLKKGIKVKRKSISSNLMNFLEQLLKIVRIFKILNFMLLNLFYVLG